MVVDADDVGVLEPGGDFRLALEPGQRVFGQRAAARVQHLNRHLLGDAKVLRDPHLAHAAAADLVQHLVGSGDD